MTQIIDVWDIKTFGDALRCLEAHNQLIKNYYDTDNAIQREHELSDHRTIARTNEYASAFMSLTDELGKLVSSRSLRAWHYARQTDAEVDAIRSAGVQPSTLGTLRRRLDALVSARAFSASVADKIFDDSPFNSEQSDIRVNRFWATSHPICVESSLVKLLLRYWGGESSYFWQTDEAILETLAKTGKARVFEISVPLTGKLRSYSAAQSMLAAYGRHLECKTDKGTFNICIKKDIPLVGILNVTTEGDENYLAIGRTYPSRFEASAG